MQTTIDDLLTPGCRALGISSPYMLSVAVLTSRKLSSTERSIARRMSDARRSGDAVAAQLASDAAVAIGDGALEVSTIGDDTIACVYCDGTGTANDGRSDCPRCSGRSYVVRS